MVLGGLEPVGDLPPPEALDPSALGIALKDLDEALHTSLFAGYFITSEMKPQLAQGSFQGVLPVLFTELALTGNIIDAAQMIRPFGSPGVQIIYHRPGGPSQTLYYFKADLSNGKECRNFLSWLRDLGPGASYLKAASYLLPLDAFSETRNFLLNTSQLILQDDSGIPYRYFTPGTWRIQLFGVYTDPLPIFKLRREAELEAAYGTTYFKGSLPFGAGYHVNASDANLLLATKERGSLGTQQPMPELPALPARLLTKRLRRNSTQEPLLSTVLDWSQALRRNGFASTTPVQRSSPMAAALTALLSRNVFPVTEAALRLMFGPMCSANALTAPAAAAFDSETDVPSITVSAEAWPVADTAAIDGATLSTSEAAVATVDAPKRAAEFFLIRPATAAVA
jgi:hypothetical protein